LLENTLGWLETVFQRKCISKSPGGACPGAPQKLTPLGLMMCPSPLPNKFNPATALL